MVKDKVALLAHVRKCEASKGGYRYKADGHELYDVMMRSLFAHVGRHGLARHVTFAVRGNKPRTHILADALAEVEDAFERDFGMARHTSTTLESTFPWKSAGLQACDYFLWALQRFYERGEERFLTAMWPQFVEIIDLDLQTAKVRGKPQRPGVTFNEKHPLTLESRAGVVKVDREI